MDNNILNEIAMKMTELENTIFMISVDLLQREGIPPTMGRIVMGNVYRQFIESANYNSSARSVSLQNELKKQKEKEQEMKEEQKDETTVIRKDKGKESKG